jgi:hypothetical protein
MSESDVGDQSLTEKDARGHSVRICREGAQSTIVVLSLAELVPSSALGFLNPRPCPWEF